jgi:hypothetical protein
VALPGFTANSSMLTTRQLPERRPRSRETGRNERPQRYGAVLPMVDIPLYGNWCGPGHAGPGAPIDAVDEACCRHDMCFCEDGYDDCACNRQGAADLVAASVAGDTLPGGRVAGPSIAAALLAAPCLCHEICGPDPTSWPPWSCWESPIPAPGFGGICQFPFA